MSVATKSIILEDVLEEIFSFLPDMADLSGATTYPVVFGYGDELELNIFLKTREKSNTYPLIWLLYPYAESHTDNDVDVTGANFILAVETNSSMQNKERIKETFTKILMPLFFNMRLAFKRANVISTDHVYSIVKHPNFSESDTKEKSATIFIWDAIKVTTNFNVRDTCLKAINF